MTLWMLYAILFGALAVGGGFALEIAARALRLPTRFAWLAMLVMALAAPLAIPLLTRSEMPAVVPDAVLTLDGAEFVQQPAVTAPMTARVAGVVGALDRPLVAAWIALSVFSLLQLAAGVIRLRRRRAQWVEREIAGTACFVTPDIGPAVVAMPETRVLLPEWVLSLDHSSLATVVRHERQHLVARDAWLIVTGSIATTLMPWNPAVWVIRQRLRLALEVDCDARVLAEDPRVDRYGSLLLAIAQRPRRIAALGATLAESTSDLERRIDAMTARPPRQPRLRAALCAGAGTLALAVACGMPAPDVVGPRAADPLAGPSMASSAYFDFQVEKPASANPQNMPPRYPDKLRAAGIEGQVLMRFVVDTMGSIEVQSAEVVKSDHEGFSTAVREALPALRFYPARVGGRPVRQLVTMPFSFSLVGRDAPSAKRPAVASETPVGPARPMVLFEVHSEGSFPKYLNTNRTPEYPAALRAANVQGSVFVRFVVRADGSVNMASFKVDRSDHEAFLTSVHAAIATWRFEPARKDGKAVAVEVHMPFMFRLQ